MGLTVGLMLLGSGCSPESPSDRVRIVVTVAPLAGLVDRVAPELVDVTVLIPPGASPVTYEPSLSRVRAASSADLLVSVGHPAFAWEETWLSGLLASSQADLIRGSEGCDVIHDDPHVWLSLACARKIADRIAAAVVRMRPEAEDSVTASLARLSDEIDELGMTAESALSPHRGGGFVVLHPAWGYVANEHGLLQMAILDHGSGDAGPAALAAIVSRARELGLTDVIVQPQFSLEPALLVATELGGTTVMLDPLDRDWGASYQRTIEVLAEQVKP